MHQSIRHTDTLQKLLGFNGLIVIPVFGIQSRWALKLLCKRPQTIPILHCYGPPLPFLPQRHLHIGQYTANSITLKNVTEIYAETESLK
jgi:hypothetical protein